MSNLAKILIALTSIALVTVIFIIISSQVVIITEKDAVVTKNEPSAQPSRKILEKVDQEALTATYKAGVKMAYREYGRIKFNMTSESSTSSKEKIATSTKTSEIKMDNLSEAAAKLKIDLMAMVVPTQYKEFHMNFVLAVTKLENYLDTGEGADLAGSIELMGQAQVNYPWLSE